MSHTCDNVPDETIEVQERAFSHVTDNGVPMGPLEAGACAAIWTWQMPGTVTGPASKNTAVSPEM